MFHFFGAINLLFTFSILTLFADMKKDREMAISKIYHSRAIDISKIWIIEKEIKNINCDLECILGAQK